MANAWVPKRKVHTLISQAGTRTRATMWQKAETTRLFKQARTALENGKLDQKKINEAIALYKQAWKFHRAGGMSIIKDLRAQRRAGNLPKNFKIPGSPEKLRSFFLRINV